MLIRALSAVLVAASVLLGTPAAAAGSHVIASWEMNEPPGARTMVDGSGHGFDGRIGREVGRARTGGAAGYRYARLDPDTPPPHPQHVVIVPDAAALDPGDRDYTVALRLRTTYQFGNIVQKGQATVAGGNWKLQIPRGIVQCLFRGSAGQIIVSSPRSYNDGRWHTVVCERRSGGVMLSVDGRTVARRSGRTGRIANSWPVAIGGKTACDQIDVGCDYYAGDLDWVRISNS